MANALFFKHLTPQLTKLSQVERNATKSHRNDNNDDKKSTMKLHHNSGINKTKYNKTTINNILSKNHTMSEQMKGNQTKKWKCTQKKKNDDGSVALQQQNGTQSTAKVRCVQQLTKTQQQGNNNNSNGGRRGKKDKQSDHFPIVAK